MKIPKHLHKYFWDVDVKKLDPEEKSYFVINRLLDKGNVQAVRWVRKNYSEKLISETFTTMRGFRPKKASFWSVFLKIPQEKNNMFTNTLSHDAQNALAILGKSKILPDKTYLAGGSSLALQFGHRISVDFNFFTPTSFDGEMKRKNLKK
jgi:hypothetical protein